MKHIMSLLCGSCLMTLAASAAAQQSKLPIPGAIVDSGAKDPNQPSLLLPIGMSATAGGGVRGYLEQSARDFAGTSGLWDARLLVGTRTVVGVEAAYSGSLGSIDALGLDTNARLLSSSVEGALRLHILPGMWQPYVMAGAGWIRYSITNDNFNTSSVADKDDQVVFPLGAGLTFRYQGIVADARGVYRPTVRADLIPQAGQDMPTWTAGLSGGAEF